jgi:hypothetical protein
MANGSWRSGTPLPSPIMIERWEFQGSEDELAEMCEKNEQLKLLKSPKQEEGIDATDRGRQQS